MAITTLWCRSDSHTINGLSALKLDITNSASNATLPATFVGLTNFPPPSCNTTFRLQSVAIRHSDGSETSLGTNVASTGKSLSGQIIQGVYSATWNCPQTNLVATDALHIIWFTQEDNPVRTATRDWVSPQLGWSKLNASTWTVYRYEYSAATIVGGGPSQFQFLVAAVLYYGDGTYTTYLDGLDYDEEGPGGSGIFFGSDF